MDTSQPYQPLSFALNPSSTSSSRPAFQGASAHSNGTRFSIRAPGDDEDDDRAIEEQLNDEGRTSRSPEVEVVNASSSGAGADGGPRDLDPSEPKKRGPGRPKGSKTRKRADGKAAPSSTPFPTSGASSSYQPRPLPQVTPENQAYYEFQWRILNLCGEFYGAAEELVRGTSPTVIAQSYQMGPNSRVDPLVILADAKRVVDSLMANPSQLITNPPPVLPPVSQFPSATPVISNPQSFTVSMQGSTSGSSQNPYQSPFHAQYPFYSAPSTSGVVGHTSSSAAVAAAVASINSGSNPPTQTQTPTQTVSRDAHSQGAREGHWSDDETEKLKALAEASRANTANGDIDWDHVINGFGGTRTRHQILIKGTTLGLKASSSKSSKGAKRRRDGESEAPPSSTNRPNPASPNGGATPQPPATQQSQSTSPSFPFPMPVIASSSSSVYRPRPSSTSSSDASRPASHPFMYQPTTHE